MDTKQPNDAQRERFIEKARELECDEDEAQFDATMDRVLRKGDQDS